MNFQKWNKTLIGGNRKLCGRLVCRSFVRNSAWLYGRHLVEFSWVRGGICLFPLLWLCLARSYGFGSGMWHVHGRKLRLVSDCQFYLTPGNAAGNWVVGIEDWFVIVIEAVNYMSTCRVRWVRILPRIPSRPIVTPKRISNRLTFRLQEHFMLEKTF